MRGTRRTHRRSSALCGLARAADVFFLVCLATMSVASAVVVTESFKRQQEERKRRSVSLSVSQSVSLCSRARQPRSATYSLTLRSSPPRRSSPPPRRSSPAARSSSSGSSSKKPAAAAADAAPVDPTVVPKRGYYFEVVKASWSSSQCLCRLVFVSSPSLLPSFSCTGAL
jgi:hypothetical protein